MEDKIRDLIPNMVQVDQKTQSVVSISITHWWTILLLLHTVPTCEKKREETNKQILNISRKGINIFLTYEFCTNHRQSLKICLHIDL